MTCTFKNKKLCKYPLVSTQNQLRTSFTSGTKYIQNHVSKKDWNLIQKVNKEFSEGNDSLKKCLNKDGTIKKSCENFHSEIINNQFKKVKSDKKDPDLYIMGGLPASGKTTFSRKFVPEKTLIIDSDEYKYRLSKRTKSPSKNFKLIHAGLLHNEADILVAEAIKKSIQQKKNVTLDMTFSNLEKGKNIINQYKEAGYDVHYLGTQKYPHRTMNHMAKRFLKNGRYVPLRNVLDKGNKISKNSWKARKLADSYLIYNTNNLHPFFVTKSKRKISDNVRDP